MGMNMSFSLSHIGVYIYAYVLHVVGDLVSYSSEELFLNYLKFICVYVCVCAHTPMYAEVSRQLGESFLSFHYVDPRY